MLEKMIEMYLVRYVKRKGGLAIKMNPAGMVGIPDRQVFLPGGKTFFVELKAPGQKPRAAQLGWHHKLRGLGFRVYVLDSREDVKRVVDEEGERE